MSLKHTERDASKILVCYLVVTILVAFLTESWTPGTAKVYVSYLIPQILFVSITLIYFRACRLPLKPAVPLKKPTNAWAFPLLLPVTLGVFFFGLLFSTALNWALRFAAVSTTINMPPITNAGSFLLSFLVLCILPAIGEELVFRGVLLSGLTRLGNVKAVLFSALAFGLIHMNAAQFLYQFIFGVVLAYVTIRTGSILYSVVIHCFSNVLAITLPLLFPFFAAISPSLINFGILAILAVAGGAVLFPALRGLMQTAGVREETGTNCGLLAFFKAEENKVWYNTQETKPKVDIWFVALLVALAATVLLTILAAAFA